MPGSLLTTTVAANWHVWFFVIEGAIALPCLAAACLWCCPVDGCVRAGSRAALSPRPVVAYNMRLRELQQVPAENATQSTLPTYVSVPSIQTHVLRVGVVPCRSASCALVHPPTIGA